MACISALKRLSLNWLYQFQFVNRFILRYPDQVFALDLPVQSEFPLTDPLGKWLLLTLSLPQSFQLCGCLSGLHFSLPFNIVHSLTGFRLFAFKGKFAVFLDFIQVFPRFDSLLNQVFQDRVVPQLRFSFPDVKTGGGLDRWPRCARWRSKAALGRHLVDLLLKLLKSVMAVFWCDERASLQTFAGKGLQFQMGGFLLLVLRFSEEFVDVFLRRLLCGCCVMWLLVRTVKRFLTASGPGTFYSLALFVTNRFVQLGQIEGILSHAVKFVPAFIYSVLAEFSEFFLVFLHSFQLGIKSTRQLGRFLLQNRRHILTAGHMRHQRCPAWEPLLGHGVAQRSCRLWRILLEQAGTWLRQSQRGSHRVPKIVEKRLKCWVAAFAEVIKGGLIFVKRLPQEQRFLNSISLQQFLLLIWREWL